MNYLKRTNAIVEKLEKENADWFLVTNLINVRYLSGFMGSSASLLIHRDKRYILTDGRYSEQVKNEVKDYEAIIQGNRKEMQAIADILGDVSNQIVWFEGDNLTVARYTAFCEAVPAKAYISKRGVVEHLRAIKDAEEIDAIRRSLRIAENAYEKALPIIQEGMSERELSFFLWEQMWKAGAIKESFDPLILFGARSSLCHGKPTDNPLKKGDIVLMDFGCMTPDGYNSDITRTVFFGKPSEEMKQMYDCVKSANRAAVRQLRAGITGVQGDEFARSVIREAGRADQFVHGLGHGVGLEIHEAPRMSPISEYDIVEGNLITVEPGVYIPGTGGIRIEDMVVIRERDCEVLNQTEREMIVL